MLRRLRIAAELAPKELRDVIVGREKRAACAGANGIWLAAPAA
jgi:hypothetical protein